MLPQIRLPFPWIKLKSQIRLILHKLALAEDQEEAELFLFRLYRDSEADLEFFTPEDRERVKGYLQFLIDDTERHKVVIAAMTEELKVIEEAAHGSRTAGEALGSEIS